MKIVLGKDEFFDHAKKLIDKSGGVGVSMLKSFQFFRTAEGKTSFFMTANVVWNEASINDIARSFISCIKNVTVESVCMVDSNIEITVCENMNDEVESMGVSKKEG